MTNIADIFTASQIHADHSLAVRAPFSYSYAGIIVLILSGTAVPGTSFPNLKWGKSTGLILQFGFISERSVVFLY